MVFISTQLAPDARPIVLQRCKISEDLGKAGLAFGRCPGALSPV
jgi:hypothetical protein